MNKLILGYNQKKLKRAALLDSLLSFVFKPITTNRNRRPISNPQKILVIQSHLIGDVVMATPMLKAIRRAYPASLIFLLANEFAKDLLEGFPYVDRIVTVKFPWAMYDYSIKNLIDMVKVIKQLRNEKFDLSIDAQIDMRNAFLLYLTGAKRRLGYDITGGRIFLTDVPEFPKNIANLLEARLSLLNYLGVDTKDKTTELPIGQENNDWVDSYLEKHNLNKGKIVGIHPGASKKEKLWQAARFAKVIEFLNSRGYQPVIIEGPNEEKIVTSIISKCKVRPPSLSSNLKNVAAFISRCELTFCLDSAVIHLAGAVNIPTVAIYGPKWPELTKPFNYNIEIIWDESFKCRPCEYGNCKNKNYTCMDAIDADTVIQKIDKMLVLYNERRIMKTHNLEDGIY